MLWFRRTEPPVALDGEFGPLHLALHPDEVVSNYIREHKAWAEEETKLLRSLIKPGQVLYDIGANIGWHTVALARSIGPKGAIYSFEPSKRNFALLKRNCQLNGVSKAKLYNVALSDIDGRAMFYEHGQNFGDHRLGGGEDHSAAGDVAVFKLETIIRRDGLRPPDLIKIDTQGSEARILSALPFLLSLKPDVTVFAEFWPFGLRSTGSSSAQLLDMIDTANLKVWMAEGAIEPTTTIELRHLGTKNEGDFNWHSNILLRRE